MLPSTLFLQVQKSSFQSKRKATRTSFLRTVFKDREKVWNNDEVLTDWSYKEDERTPRNKVDPAGKSRQSHRRAGHDHQGFSHCFHKDHRHHEKYPRLKFTNFVNVPTNIPMQSTFYDCATNPKRNTGARHLVGKRP